MASFPDLGEARILAPRRQSPRAGRPPDRGGVEAGKPSPYLCRRRADEGVLVAKVKQLPCGVCGGVMKRKRVGTTTALDVALAIIALLIGISLCLTIIGAILGVPLMLVALFMVSKTKNVWKCRDCGQSFDRDGGTPILQGRPIVLAAAPQPSWFSPTQLATAPHPPTAPAPAQAVTPALPPPAPRPPARPSIATPRLPQGGAGPLPTCESFFLCRRVEVGADRSFTTSGILTSLEVPGLPTTVSLGIFARLAGVQAHHQLRFLVCAPDGRHLGKGNLRTSMERDGRRPIDIGTNIPALTLTTAGRYVIAIRESDATTIAETALEIRVRSRR